MNVLLISYYFAPVNSIASVRPGKLCKYWMRQGHNVTVLTRAYGNSSASPHGDGMPDELRQCRIIRTKIFSIQQLTKKAMGLESRQSVEKTVGKINRSPLHHLYRWFSNLFNEDNITWYWLSRRKIRELMRNGDYDLIFSTCGPVASHKIAYYAKSLASSSVWIADFRDHYVNMSSSVNRLKLMFLKGFTRKVIQKANAVTCVSAGLADALNGNNSDTPFRVLPNGFDRDDYQKLAEEQKETAGSGGRTFRMVYTGYLYGKKRDVSPLFRAIGELADEHAIDRDRVRFLYAGQQGEYIRQFAATYGLEQIVEDVGSVSHEKSLLLQSTADALILSTWNYRNEQGIVTGKIYEYMMQDKPIIALVNGDLAGSAVAGLIGECRLGVVWEQAGDMEDYPRLKSYLLHLYRCAMENRPSAFEPDREAIARYSYEQIARSFVDLYGTLHGA